MNARRSFAARAPRLAICHALIADDSPISAQRLRDAVAAAGARIGEYPQVGHHRLDVAPEDFRFIVVTGFPYVIVYNATRVPPLIVRVLHTSRDLSDALGDLQ